MKIVITAPSLDPQKNVSGISTVVQDIMDNGKNSYIHYLLGSDDRNKNKKSFSRLVKIFTSIYNFKSFLSENNPDIVHINLPCDTKGILREYFIFRFSKKKKIKTLVHLHGGEFLMKKPENNFVLYCFKYILSRADKIIVLSEIEKERVAQLYSCQNTAVLYNSVDTTNSFKEFVIEERKKIKFLFLGRLHESKGLEDIAEALSRLYKDFRIEFILCGAGPLETEIVKTCSKELSSDFKFKGIVTGEEKRQIILDADVFLLPSRYGEGLPMALLETMAAGVIPVVTDDASMKFVVSHNENGIVVEKCNPNDLYYKIKTLLDNPQLMSKLSLNARKTIIEKFNIKDFTQKLEHIYNEII